MDLTSIFDIDQLFAVNSPVPEWFPLLELYKVSYSWYGFIGIASSVIIGVVVSLLTGGWRKCE